MLVGGYSEKTGYAHSLRVWLGMVTTMAIVIEYYLPEKFRKQSGKWIPPEQRGNIFPFPAPKKSRHDGKTLRLVQASGKIRCFASRFANGKE